MHPRSRILILAAILALGSSCQREDGDSLEGRSISHLEFRYEGPNTIEEERLRRFVSSKPGTAYSLEVVDADLMRLYESGLVDDVRFLTEADGDSVRIIALVSPRSPIRYRVFSIGNSSFSSKRLRTESGLSESDPITVEALEISRQELKRFYVLQGYSKVTVTTDSINGGEAHPDDYVFVIEEGSKEITPSAETETAEQDGADQPAAAVK